MECTPSFVFLDNLTHPLPKYDSVQKSCPEPTGGAPTRRQTDSISSFPFPGFRSPPLRSTLRPAAAACHFTPHQRPAAFGLP